MPEVTEKKAKPSQFPALSAISTWMIGLTIMSGFVVAAVYWYRTRIPTVVTIAGGPANGRYAELAEGLARELEDRLNVTVKVKQTLGSLENLRMLETHTVDIALYQPETQLILEGHESGSGSLEPANFVSNLYAEYLIPISSVSNLVDLNSIEGRIWCCNDRLSGDYAMTRLLLRHLGINEDKVSVESVTYSELPARVRDGKVDIGIVCCGLHAPILKDVLDPAVAAVAAIPAVDAFAQKNTSLSRGTIPAGFFRTSPGVPAEDFHTVTLQAQLLADRDASVRLIEEVTRIVTDPRFQRKMGLTELFDGGLNYAMNRPEYEMHPGAQHVFNPELKPLLNPDFVEGTEGLRSFIVSLLAATWLLHRWWSRRQVRSQEHRLDRYIRDLLSLEQRQMAVDGEGGREESGILQNLLDQVTILRQEALSEFTAHEINEDRAVDCFIHMCHALSDKINAKLIRHSILTATAARSSSGEK